MRVVFDTNIYVSGLLFKGGIPSRLLDLARDKKFLLFLSPEILAELRDVLKIKFDLTLHEIDRLIRWIEGAGELIYPKERVALVKKCDEDNRILECALAAKADYLVTGDKQHLLSLKHSLSLRIVSPSTFFGLMK